MSQTILAAFLLVLIVSFILYLALKRRQKSMDKSLNLPPGSYGWPILGETMEYLQAGKNGTPEKFMVERKEKYKSQVFKTSLLGEKMAVLSGSAGNKFLFTNESKLVRIWWPPSVKKLLGTCLATKDGDEAMIMRNMMAKFMSPDAFSMHYIRTMNLVSQQQINTHWQGKEEVMVFPTIKAHWFELVCRLFMSLEEADQIAELASLFYIFVKEIISIPVDFPGTRFYKAKKASHAIKRRLLNIVRQRRVALGQETSDPSQDLLSHLLVLPDKNGEFMSESVVVNNLHMLIMAGHDISAAAMTMLMKNLAQFPEIYEKVLTEQKEIASSKATGEFLHWEDIQKMRYSWCVASEAMRLFPPGIGSFREAITDIKYQGYHIPKGWKFYWSAPLTHRDPSIHLDHQKFDPSRFEGTGPPPYSYIPFGGGPRTCLGKDFAKMLMLIFLHNVILKFRWELLIPDEKIEYDPIPIPVKGLPVRLHSHTA